MKIHEILTTIRTVIEYVYNNLDDIMKAFDTFVTLFTMFEKLLDKLFGDSEFDDVKEQITPFVSGMLKK